MIYKCFRFLGFMGRGFFSMICSAIETKPWIFVEQIHRGAEGDRRRLKDRLEINWPKKNKTSSLYARAFTNYSGKYNSP